MTPVVAAYLLLACADPLDAPPASQQARDLCTHENVRVLQELVAGCRDAWATDKSCAGILSFHGEVEGVPTKLEGTVTSVKFDDVIRADDSVVRGAVTMDGRGPYFELSFRFTSLGGVISDTDRVGRRLRVGGSSEDGKLEDDQTAISFQLASDAQSRDLAASSGYLVIDTQKEQEESGRFEIRAPRGPNTVIAGCFVVFPTRIRRTMEAGLD